MIEQCRSDCRNPIEQRVRAVSQSGRAWSSSVCGDPEHLDGTLAMIAALGFEVREVVPVAAVS